MAAGSVVLAGISSTLLLATQSFNGSGAAVAQNRATDVRDGIADDLRYTKAFVTRQDDKVTVLIPDRDGDGSDETVEYEWTGATDQKITRSLNGGSALTIAEGISDFSFSYVPRTFPGSVPDPGFSDSTKWGQRWSTGEKRFGYPTVYWSKSGEPYNLLAIEASLGEDAVLKSISAYFSPKEKGKSEGKAAMAVFSSKNGAPNKLIAGSGFATLSKEGWVTVSVEETKMEAGKYFLVLYYQGDNWEHRHQSSFFTKVNAYKVEHKNGGWPSTFPSKKDTETSLLSIYGSYVPQE